jgi:phosphatidylglycerol---prolipoprotein diacylglyceryl transferase
MLQGFYIGPLFIHFYGIILMLGALFAAWLASRLAVQYGQNPDLIWDVFPWLLVAGVIGARIWHVLTPPASMQVRGAGVNYYFSNPIEILNFRAGGLGIPGAVIGGLIALYFYCKKNNVSLAIITDIIAPGLALGQAIGRWGNFVNQELYGQPSTLPWAIHIDPAFRLPAYQDVATYHPLFLYESIWNLLNMALLLWMGKKLSRLLRPGDIFLTYLVVYPVGRFMLEFLRLDPSPVSGLNINQTLMAVTALSAGTALLIRLRNRPLLEKSETDDLKEPNQESVE